ncbi:ABC-three component system middle component 1 [Vibrio diabolicus]|uniref:ABC-three component system middle component 1 n=1 Tax=Vibrio diabolicus TaxID=50719 RepID=UPI0035A99D9A
MPLVNADYVLENIREMDESFNFNNLSCWKKEESSYDIYIFNIQCKSESELSAIYSDLRDYIAIYFQGQILSKDVERWNIYQFYIVEGEVSRTFEFSVEQDKFSTRKIVKSNVGKYLNDEEIKDLIYKEIFDLNVNDSNIPDVSLEASLDVDSITTLNLIEKYFDENSKQDLDSIIEELSNE